MSHLQKKPTVLLATAACLVTGLALASPAAATKPGSGSATGTGSVFKVNPVQSSGDESPDRPEGLGHGGPGAASTRPCSCATSTAPATCVGKWANVRSSHRAGGVQPDQHVRLPPRRRPLRAGHGLLLGEPGAGVPAVARLRLDAAAGERREPGRARSTSTAATTAPPTTSTTTITLGKGGVDDAEDAEVIVHEYGHAVHDAQVPGFGTSLDAGLDRRGVRRLPRRHGRRWRGQQYGWPVKTPEPCVADWDSVSYTSDRPALPAPPRHRPRTWRTGSGEVHVDGEIWSARALGHPAAATSRSASRPATGTAP